MLCGAEGRAHSPGRPGSWLAAGLLGVCLAAALLAVCLGGGLLAACAGLPRTPAAPAPPAFPAPSASSGRALAIGVLIAGWHSGLVLPADEIGPLALLLRPAAQAHDLGFGWGNRRFYMSPDPGPAAALAALLRSRSVLLVESARTAGALARESDATLRWLCASRAQLLRLDVYLEHSLALTSGRPIDLGAGALPRSAFYASTGKYDAFDTCNTWTMAALAYAGLPASARGVIFAGQVRARIAALPVCKVPTGR
jgi:hypothetical protein